MEGDMPGRSIVYGQRVRKKKHEAARRLRRSMTSHERMLWKELRRQRHGGLHFRRQQIVGGFIVDFYSNVAVLGIEVDGDVHLGQEDYDRDRDQVLIDRGLTILHFTNREILRDLSE
jgi:very-short-patch-repair endonuclease